MVNLEPKMANIAPLALILILFNAKMSQFCSKLQTTGGRIKKTRVKKTSGRVKKTSGRVKKTRRRVKKTRTGWKDVCQKMRQVRPKMAPRWRYAGILESRRTSLGPALGGILGYLLDLERDLSKNHRSVKTSNATTLLVVFLRLGDRLEAALGSFWIMVSPR